MEGVIDKDNTYAAKKNLTTGKEKKHEFLAIIK